MSSLAKHFVIITVGSLLAVSIATPAVAQDAPVVVVLFDERPNVPSATLFWQGLGEAMAASPAVLVQEHLDASRHQDDPQLAKTAGWLQSQYRGRRVAVLVTFGEAASSFAIRYGEAIWPGARLIHTNVADSGLQELRDRGEPVVARRTSDFRQAVERALQLLPDVRQVWLIGAGRRRGTVN